MIDSLGAFCRFLSIHMEGVGPLSDLSFAVKDLFDVAGELTGAGNPEWLKAHGPAQTTATAVQTLLDAGATLVGKTITDELAFSLTGRNVHYGTPLNPNAPDRLPGGSSSGSASAVAGGAVDFALGTDTGGSVRIPASYCGIYGIRPTHGRIPLTGVVPFSPSFDTVGWFAREAVLLDHVGGVLLGGATRPPKPRHIIFAEDAFALASSETANAGKQLVGKLGDLFGDAEAVQVCATNLSEWRETFRALRSLEVSRSHGAWIEQAKPRFGPEIERNFRVAARVSETQGHLLAPVRAQIAERLAGLLEGDILMCLPTAQGPAPKRAASDEELESVRDRTQALTCIAGLGGLPEITIPAGTVDGAPVGLSLIAARGGDAMLLAVAAQMAAHGIVASGQGG